MSACAPLSTDLSLEEASAILEPYFEAVREQFVAFGLDRCAAPRLTVAEWVHDSPRHFAACDPDDDCRIYVAPELAELDYPIVLAIFSHEFGHATDFLYPAEFLVADSDHVLRQTMAEYAEPKHWSRQLRRWKERSADRVEQDADALAFYVQGVRYGYLGPCALQSFGATRRRPRGLR